MKAHLKELSHQLLGSLTDQADVLEHFSTDASIFQITPSAVAYPQNTADVRKIVVVLAARAAAGKPASLIPRGYGSGQGGGALGEGLQVVFPAHMNKLIRLDHDAVTVQPGILGQTLQQTLYTHGRFLPTAPATAGYSSIGGAVANDDSGERSLKYGAVRAAVKGLKVVLADGSLIKTHRLSARELNRKKGLSTLEGEVYRKLDSLILDHAKLIARHQPRAAQNAAGYALGHVRGKDGSFDIGQIFIGAQGTLGLITEVTLATTRYNPRASLVVGYLKTLTGLDEIVNKLRALKPSAVELVDAGVLEYVRANRPGELAGLLPDQLPKAVLLIEFDDFSQLRQKLRAAQAQRILARHGATVRAATDPVEQVALWKLRRSTAAAAMWMQNNPKPALPFIEDTTVPPGKLEEFLDKTTKLLKQYDLDAAIWGSAGTGHLRLYPRFSLAKKKDVDRLLHLSREYHELVIALGGAMGGGLLRDTYLPKLYGDEMMEVMASVKHIFDPHSIFNPFKKTQATEAYAHAHLRGEYSLKPLFDHLVYS
ncbi:MAG: hypothetical protein JWN01_413 [Patescibacteria group bacterium]|nr:hypothetical protein [Patescibacteria group bacterium]